MGGRRDIAIVGAGVGGLAAGIALARAGHRVTLYERFASSQPIGAGLMLQPPGLAALERLGLRDKMEALGARIDRLHGVTARGAVIFDLAYADLDPNLYALAVHRAALHATLWNAFAACGAAIETSWTVAAVETDADRRANLVDEAGRRSPRFDLIVDASGARSPLRPIVTNASPRPFAYGAVWTSVPDRAIAPAVLAQRYVAARVMIGHLPVGRANADGLPLAAFFWSLKPERFAQWRADFNAWRDEVVRLWPAMEPVAAGFAGPDDFTLANYAHFTAAQPFRGPLALIGDAAHATSPQLGQGANNAMLDAVALTDALDEKADIGQALETYACFRRRHIRFYQLASATLTPFFQSDSQILAGFRDLVFNRIRIIPYMRREMARTLAGVKTGLFASTEPAALARLSRRYGN